MIRSGHRSSRIADEARPWMGAIRPSIKQAGMPRYRVGNRRAGHRRCPTDSDPRPGRIAASVRPRPTGRRENRPGKRQAHLAARRDDVGARNGLKIRTPRHLSDSVPFWLSPPMRTNLGDTDTRNVTNAQQTGSKPSGRHPRARTATAMPPRGPRMRVWGGEDGRCHRRMSSRRRAIYSHPPRRKRHSMAPAITRHRVQKSG